ncbi:hypothetical protein SteCoe_36806 [Stentor coeruleus]|uniref:Uncharacterized protein n=1 Tax=Stentor coeruleus TaxID=5963 RepID=A0A1R2APA0_9CILI|nr:hypothetical protein SteCoe_36806 [Stentor coeruleus]
MYTDKHEKNLVKYFAIALNEPTNGLCQIQKYIKKTTPDNIQLRQKIKIFYEKQISAIPDIENTVSEIKKIKKLEEQFIPNMKNHLDSALAALDKPKK